MCLQIIPKTDLTEEQLRHIAEHISAPEHVDDTGPTTVWNTYQQGLYAVVDSESNMPIGIIEASWPPESVAPGWWLDSRARDKGLGNKMVDVLAEFLKKLGFTGVGNIRIQTRNQVYDKASNVLTRRFRSHFDE